VGVATDTLALPAWANPKRLRALQWVLVVGALLVLQGPAFKQSLEWTIHGDHISGDARQQIVPFLKFVEPAAFSDDYAANYYLDCLFPLGYLGLFRITTQIGIDPVLCARWLSHGLLLGALFGLGAVAHKLGGKWGALCATALALGSHAFLHRMNGGLPRSFGLPIMALTLAALAYARVAWCVAAVLLGALFYPVAGLLSGLCLTGWMLLPQRWGGSALPALRRWILLGGAAVLAAALLAPMALNGRKYGPFVRADELTAFPEAGPHGRYGPESRAPFPEFLDTLRPEFDRVLLAPGASWLPGAREWMLGENRQHPRRSLRYVWVTRLLSISMLLGSVLLARKQAAARRLLIVPCVVVLGYNVSRHVAPYAYLPERYISTVVPLLFCLAAATGVSGWWGLDSNVPWKKWLQRLVVGGYSIALLAAFGARLRPGEGLGVDVQAEKPLYAAIAALPPSARIAGWPEGPTDSIPYMSRRPAWVTFETHQAFHKEYILEMRRRMRAFLDAYFATTLEPLLRLRDEFGVTHLLVDRTHFSKQPEYFEPFDTWAHDARLAGRGRKWEVLKQAKVASVFIDGKLQLLDLARLSAPPALPVEPPEGNEPEQLLPEPPVPEPSPSRP
jgi:hypothetical protein